jgi:excinuclease UvrABC nuclease subunit
MFDLLFLNELSLDELDRLPNQAGIYFAMREGTVIYVGRSTDLHRRWNAKDDRQHHKLAKFRRMGGVTLKYKVVAEWRVNHEEAKAIAKYRPAENGRNESTNPLISCLDAVGFVAIVLATLYAAQNLKAPNLLPPLEVQNVR